MIRSLVVVVLLASSSAAAFYLDPTLISSHVEDRRPVQHASITVPDVPDLSLAPNFVMPPRPLLKTPVLAAR
jgi:hypothetical protein